MSDILRAENLSASYGHVQALHTVNLTVDEGALVAILGPNGAGKSTLMRAIMGLVATSGRVLFRGTALPRHDPTKVAARGVVLVPEGRGIFGPMTVAENLALGAYCVRDRHVIAERRERVLALFPRLGERLTQIAGAMSGGEQQMLAIGRALMAGPQILLLDEPSLGLAPRVIGEIMAILGQLNREGLAIILVEQKAPLALKLAHRAYLLKVGRIVAALNPDEITSHDALVQHYFG
jgi:branched-chain amino acid transport system ATP-binding protein